jgi:hypothetical protein
MKETIPSSALAMMPNCGHGLNIKDPVRFNRIVGDFLARADSGRWPIRDPRATSAPSSACVDHKKRQGNVP